MRSPPTSSASKPTAAQPLSLARHLCPQIAVASRILAHSHSTAQSAASRKWLIFVALREQQPVQRMRVPDRRDDVPACPDDLVRPQSAHSGCERPDRFTHDKPRFSAPGSAQTIRYSADPSPHTIALGRRFCRWLFQRRAKASPARRTATGSTAVANRQANAALHRIIFVRLRYHQPTKDYLERRTSEGKNKREIIRCLNASSPARSPSAHPDR
jgi:hypothetical protein